MIRYNLMYHIRPFGGTICSYHVRPFSGNPKLLILRKLSLFDILKITFFVSLFPTRLLSLLCNWKEFILLYSGVFVYCSQEKYSRVCTHILKVFANLLNPTSRDVLTINSCNIVAPGAEPR